MTLALSRNRCVRRTLTFLYPIHDRTPIYSSGKLSKITSIRLRVIHTLIGPSTNSTSRFCFFRKGKPLLLYHHMSENEQDASCPQQISRSMFTSRLDLLWSMTNTLVTQLYEEDARIGHREFDLKLTQRVKMSMVGPSDVVPGRFAQSASGWCTGDGFQLLGGVSIFLWCISVSEFG